MNSSYECHLSRHVAQGCAQKCLLHSLLISKVPVVGVRVAQVLLYFLLRPFAPGSPAHVPTMAKGSGFEAAERRINEIAEVTQIILPPPDADHILS